MATRVETVRFYEKEGLLPAPEQNSGNYRIYRQAHLNRLSFIRRSRDLGFLLDQVRTILKLADKRDASCAQVGSITAINIAEINRKVTNLSAARRPDAKIRKLRRLDDRRLPDHRSFGACRRVSTAEVSRLSISPAIHLCPSRRGERDMS